MTERLACDAAAIERAAALLAAGEIVAFPTETVYGLGARADHAEAVRRIFAAKGRPALKPLIVHVTGAEQARPFARDWDERAERVTRLCWPGPLTLVVAHAGRLPREVTAGGPTVALRAPAHEGARALLEACGFALAAPSANPSGAPPPVTAEEVVAALGGRVPLVLDGGRCPVGTPSTIVDLTRSPAVILREGAISRGALARLLELGGP
jgi:L-threonylcarbamoyladenylate synthase